MVRWAERLGPEVPLREGHAGLITGGLVKQTYTLGLDYGTNSVRAVVVSCTDGRTTGAHVFDYPSGERGVIVDAGDPHLARQNPADYVEGLRVAAAGALAEASADSGFSRDRVVGIGVDTTGSTPIPIDARCRPLAFDSKWRANPAAQAWLWKDHTAAAEAESITQVARDHAPEYLAPIGGTYSSEWFWSKVWHCLNVAPDVFEAAATWVELADFIPAVLAGVPDPRTIFRCVCAAGHKAMYSREWGGLPSEDFLARLDPRLAELRGRSEVPVVVFSYLNPIHSRGVGSFVREAAEAGADGILPTDLPLGADPDLEALLADSPLDLVRLIAPTTRPDRIREIAGASQGFVYYIARTGVTGARRELRSELAREVAAVRAVSSLPVAVGFGVSTPGHARAVGAVADAAVVGSALVDALDSGGVSGALDLARALRTALDEVGPAVPPETDPA